MIRLEHFSGIFPKKSRYLLPNGAAAVARDCEFRGGILQPRRRAHREGAPTNADNQLVPNAGGFVYLGAGDFRATATPVYQTQWRDRVLVAGAGNPCYWRGKQLAAKEFTLGVPKPPQYWAIQPSRVGGAQGVAVEVRYAFSWLTRDGDQSDLWATQDAAFITGTANFAGGDTVRLTSSGTLEIPPNIDTEDLKIEIWATPSAAGAGNFHWIGSIDANKGAQQTSGNYALRDALDFTDKGDAGTPRREVKRIYSDTTLPPAGMKKMVYMPGDFLAGHDGHRVYFSEVGQAAVWPREYVWPSYSSSFTAETASSGEIIGLEVDVDTLYVFFAGAPPVVITALTPGVSGEPPYFSSIPWPCVRGDSVVNTGRGIFYASASGMVALHGAQGELLTKDFWDERTFADFLPSRCYSYEGNIIGVGKDTWILDSQSDSGWALTTASESIKDAKVVNGVLYFLGGGEIFSLNQGNEFHTANWESGILRQPRPITFSAAETMAEYQTAKHVSVRGGIGAGTIGDYAVAKPPVKVAADEPDEEVAVVNVVGHFGRQCEMLTTVGFNSYAPVAIHAPQVEDYSLQIQTKIPVNRVSIVEHMRELTGA